MRANKPGRPPKEQLKKTIAEMRKKGLSYKEIADFLGMTRQNITYHFKIYPQERLVKE